MQVGPILKVKMGLVWNMNIGCLYICNRGRKRRNIGCEDKGGWNNDTETVPPLMSLSMLFPFALLIFVSLTSVSNPMTAVFPKVYFSFGIKSFIFVLTCISVNV